MKRSALVLCSLRKGINLGLMKSRKTADASVSQGVIDASNL